jgi:hypothetical protein
MIVYRAADGARRVLVTISDFWNGHAEERLLAAIRRRNISNANIEFLYTELRPCDSCFANIHQELPDVPIRFHYRTEHMS